MAAYGVYPILNVADLDRSYAFYKGLGFRTKDESMPMGPGSTMRWITVSAGRDHSFRLFARDFEGADPADVAWASGEVGKGVLLNIGVSDARKFHERAKATRAKPETLEENPWGGRGFMIADPDGYYLMITDKFPPEPKPAKKAKRAGKAKRAKATRKAAAKAAKPAAKKGAKKPAATKRAGKKAAKKARRG